VGEYGINMQQKQKKVTSPLTPLLRIPHAQEIEAE
jgi:hypothetical protein